MIHEPSINQLKNILYGVKNEYEKYHNLIIDNSIIDNILKLNDMYITKNCNPDKSLDILDTLCAHIVLNNSNKNNGEDDTKIKKAFIEKDYETANKLFLESKNKKVVKKKIISEDVLYIIEQKNKTLSKKNSSIGFVNNKG